MLKRILSVFLAITMVVGMLPVSASAAEAIADNGKTEVSDEKIEITVNVGPSTANVTFYSDAERTVPLTEDEVADKGEVEKYHQYILTVPAGEFYYQGLEGEQGLGGMSFHADAENSTIYLRRVNYYGNKNATPSIGDYTLTLDEVVCGDQYVDSSRGAVTPVLLVARGSTGKYTPKVTLSESVSENYVLKSISQTSVNKGISAQNASFSLTQLLSHTITAPADAQVQVFNQVKNYVVEPVNNTATAENEGGTVTTTFKIPAGSSYSYRVSKEGMITYSGYLQSKQADKIVVDYTDAPAADTTQTTATNKESTVFVNVNAQNDMNLAVGDTFRLRAFRGWQITNSITANIIIEPDYNYSIISGGEHIQLKAVEGKCTGSAGSGLSANWVDIVGISEGTAIVEVSYDAIVVGDQVYGATDPARKMLVVIHVGGTDNTASITAKGREDKWDAEFDTVYFTEEKGELTFSAVVDETVPEKVELSTDKGQSWTTICDNEDGTYTASDLEAGCNLLKLTSGSISEYQVVRAAKLSYTVKRDDVELTQEDDISVGDELVITFDGLYTPIPKMAGIYNPGYVGWPADRVANGHKVVYTVPEDWTVSNSFSQYDFARNNAYTVTAATAVEAVLSEGYIRFNNMGDPAGAHRNLTDEGRMVNMTASNAYYNTSVLPDLTLGSGIVKNEFGFTDSEIAGWVTVSFEDNGIRVAEESDLKYPTALGTIVEATKVPFLEDETVAQITVRLLEYLKIDYKYSGTVEEGFYLSSINNFTVNGTSYDSLAEFDVGQGSGWMVTLNDVFINKGASEFPVKEGDVIEWQYTCQMGADIGDTYKDEDVEAVKALIDAIGTVTKDSEAAIAAARNAYDKLSDLQKRMVTNYITLTEAEAALEELNKPTEPEQTDPSKPEDTKPEAPSYEEIYKATGDYMEALGTPTVNPIGGEWMVIGLVRSGRDVPEGYYEEVVKYVRENINDKEQLHRAKSTENARVILALTAAGYDVTNVAGHNLLVGLNTMSYVKKQGINGPIWALIAFDSYDYAIPEGDVIRETLIDTILAAQLPDGGWTLSSTATSSDADLTGMAIQALAPYYESNAKVKTAVDKALALLSEIQEADGSFGSVDGSCTESTAQVIVALTAMGIDPEKDSRFIKNGNSAVDALSQFYVEGGGFKHIAADTKADGMATEQGYYALAAYDRFLSGETSLYDMSDVEIEINTEIPECEHENVTVEGEKKENCAEAGYTGDTYCADCGELLEEGKEVSATGHSKTDVKNKKAATCTEDGYTGDTYCTVCSELITAGEEIPAAGHGKTELRDAKEATDLEAGYTGDTYCTVCGEKIESGKSIPAVGHGKTECKNQKNATCTEDGYTGDAYCVDCGVLVEKGEVIAATGHDFGVWMLVEEAKLSREGLMQRTCKNCGETENKILEKLEFPFTDVKETSYAYETIAWAVDEGITTGMTHTTFVPEGLVTRAQVVTFLWRAAGEPKAESAENPFVDVAESESSAWYYDAVLWAVEAGITTGRDVNHFAPDETCTRAEVVTFLWRAAEKPDVDASENPFKDVVESKYTSWYYNAVLWAVGEKITTGVSADSFAPNDTCKREQIVTFLYRYMNN